jgi:hypothetical protein
VLDRAGTREALWLDNAGGGAPPVTDAGAVLAATAQGAPGSAASDPTEDAPPSIMPGDEALAAQATAEARGSAAGGKPE